MRIAALLALVLLTPPTLADAPRPNIILIYADDMGYADLSCYGAKAIRTPHLDGLAQQGMRFTDFYVAQAVCSASRTALLTGCYPNRIGMLGALAPASKTGISDQEMTLGELVKQKGYRTAVFGKWHLGHHPQFLPTRHGFDRYFGLPYSNDMWPKHPNPKNNFPPLPLIDGEKTIEIDPDQSQLTKRYTERAVQFITEHKSEPFFLYLPHSMPHVPIFAHPDRAGQSPGGLYGDVIEEIDASVGTILATLTKHGLDRNTLVIFTSDNGPWLSYGDHAGSAGPLREGKGTSWDGGVRVPCIMRWPGQIPAGSTCREPIMTIDLFPTIARIIDAKLPDHPIDGRDVLPLLQGQKDAKSPHDALYFYWGRELQAVRSGKWKLHFPHAYQSLDGKPGGRDGKPAPYVAKQTPLALYDLDADIGESKNVVADHPDVVKRLTALAEQARTELGDSTTKQMGTGVRPVGQLKASAPMKQPNIVFLFSDDQRFDTIAALGHPQVKTPNLDKLVARGMTFTHAHIMGGNVPAVCMPSRAMLMSGRSLFRVQNDLPTGTPLMPEVFGLAGYRTHGIGKWHNGQASYNRAFQGGDAIFFGGMSDQRKIGVWNYAANGKYPMSARKIGTEFSTTLFADAAVKFLQRSHDRPFFLYVAFTSPHDPRTPPPEFAKLYDPAKIELPKNFMPEHPFDNGELKIRDELLAPFPRTPENVRQQIADYYGMISELDANIGRILTAIEQSGEADNTIIVFAGDNGLAVGQHGLMGKQSLYDHSVRVPLIIAGPGVNAGKSDALCYLFDVFPTLAEAAGVAVPQGVEGRSLQPIMRREAQTHRDELFFAYRDVQRAIKADGWKLIHYPKIARTQLFDLVRDPLEQHDLAAVAAHAERRAMLERRLAAAQKTWGDPLIRK